MNSKGLSTHHKKVIKNHLEYILEGNSYVEDLEEFAQTYTPSDVRTGRQEIQNHFIDRYVKLRDAYKESGKFPGKYLQMAREDAITSTLTYVMVYRERFQNGK